MRLRNFAFVWSSFSRSNLNILHSAKCFTQPNQRSARILDPGNSRRESASFFLARPREMIFWSLDLVSKHESNKMESRSRLEIREWSYDNLDLVSPGESKKNNSQSRLEKLHLLSRVGVRFLICIWVFKLVFGCQVEKVWSRAPLPGTSWSV